MPSMPLLLPARRALNKQRSSLALAALVAILIWICDVSGWLNPFDNALYDIVMRVQLNYYQPPIRTLLCYVDSETAETPEMLDALIERIATAHPRGIAVTFPSPESQEGTGRSPDSTWFNHRREKFNGPRGNSVQRRPGALQS